MQLPLSDHTLLEFQRCGTACLGSLHLSQAAVLGNQRGRWFSEGEVRVREKEMPVRRCDEEITQDSYLMNTAFDQCFPKAQSKYGLEILPAS